MISSLCSDCEQKPSPRQRQHASVHIAESLARFIALLRTSHLHSQNEMAKTQTAIPCDDLFGDVPHGTIVAAAVPFEQLKGWR